MSSNWKMVLGFEVHVELGTKSKMFCGCPADHFKAKPNTQTCPVCLGLPGALPVANSRAIDWCIKLGLALNCEVNLTSKFDRKNYFYPDLPKGYQISQYDQPFCHSGWLDLSSGKRIRITRVHMEEDTGKLLHDDIDGKKVTLVDFNRSGVPLVEIVTEPDFDNLEEATEFLKEIQLIVRTLGISTADMEKGSMRLEANISVKPAGQKDLPGYKVEIKNVNSFRFIKKAIEYEVIRQTQILESGATPAQETRGFKENTGQTHSQRSKEDAHDYRYFPEPDIPPFKLAGDDIANWKKQLPELPHISRSRLESQGVSRDTSSVIVSSANRLAKFDQLLKSHSGKAKIIADLVANTPEEKIASLELIEKELFSDIDKIKSVAKQVVANNPDAVNQIKQGKEQAKFFLIGQMKKELGANLDVPLAKRLLEEIV